MTGDAATPFQVDLGGLVDLLSHHLYSSPRVYLRELLQNAVDAITARHAAGDSTPGEIHLVPADVSADGRLHVRDNGIGLDRPAMSQVLATIGASSKRDDFGFHREGFLGQFGIGLLACFLVTDRIEIHSRAAGATALRWEGGSDGRYRIADAPDGNHIAGVGTDVALSVGRHDASLLGLDTVRQLLGEYATYLPVRVRLDTGSGVEEYGNHRFPWESPGDGAARRGEAEALCRSLLGYQPLDLIALDDAASGLRGYAFIRPVAGTGAHHRVYVQRMFVGDQVTGLLPDWAFFVQVVADAERLSLTASREALQADDLLAETREGLGERIASWLRRVAASDPIRMRRFLAVHHLGAKAMAAQDDAMLAAIADLLTWETTEGSLTLPEFAEDRSEVAYSTSAEEFEHLAPFARAQGLAVLNAGYAYDEPIVRRWLANRPELTARQVTPSDLLETFAEVGKDERIRFASLLDVARAVLDRADCRPNVRRFAPADVPALLLLGGDQRRARDHRAVADGAEGGWLAALESLDMPEPAAELVFNAANPTLARLADTGSDEVRRLAVEALYAQALLTGRHPLRPFDRALIARSVPALLDRVIDGDAHGR